MNDQELLLQRAKGLAQNGYYEEARTAALEVFRQDPTNTSALWVIAISTSSPTERRNTLTRLLRLQPDNRQARAMLDELSQQLTSPDTTPKRPSSVIRPLYTEPEAANTRQRTNPMLLVGLGVAVFVFAVGALLLLILN
ncbi:MAG: hypothetical protein GYB67_04825 [Chloroflexi bacterium]|nr:hypothetical protein [Chloroflexota bacterium]